MVNIPFLLRAFESRVECGPSAGGRLTREVCLSRALVVCFEPVCDQVPDFRHIANSAPSRTARLLHDCVAVALADADDESLIRSGHCAFVPAQSRVTAVQPVR